MHPSSRATLIGASTIGLWATLALLTAAGGPVPPFQKVAMAFAIAFLIGMVYQARRRGAERLRLPWRVWLLGVGGLFGYHFFYFLAVRLAPPVEANLLNYLWPLLIVLLAAVLLPGERLRWFHVAGSLFGLLGAALLVTRGGGLAIEARYAAGYLSAVLAAVIWAVYSVLSRRYGSVPTSAVGWFCGVTAVLGALCHLLFEQTVWPVGAQWWAIVGLGLGPVGLAFFTWDVGMKRGDIKLLGALSYTIPLLSTGLLVLFGQAQMTWRIAAACGLIVAGAILAAGERFGWGRRASAVGRAGVGK